MIKNCIVCDKPIETNRRATLLNDCQACEDALRKKSVEYWERKLQQAEFAFREASSKRQQALKELQRAQEALDEIAKQDLKTAEGG